MAKSENLDLYKEHKAEDAASKTKPALVEVGPAVYLVVQGQGEPGGAASRRSGYGPSSATPCAAGEVSGTQRASPRGACHGDSRVPPCIDGRSAPGRPHPAWPRLEMASYVW